MRIQLHRGGIDVFNSDGKGGEGRTAHHLLYVSRLGQAVVVVVCRLVFILALKSTFFFFLSWGGMEGRFSLNGSFLFLNSRGWLMLSLLLLLLSAGLAERMVGMEGSRVRASLFPFLFVDGGVGLGGHHGLLAHGLQDGALDKLKKIKLIPKTCSFHERNAELLVLQGPSSIYLHPLKKAHVLGHKF